MSIQVIVPSPGESINQVQIAAWLVSDGDYVEKDAEIVEIDSDKATLSIAAEAPGAVKILVDEGETVDVGAVIAEIDTTAAAPEKAAAPKAAAKEPLEETKTETVTPPAKPTPEATEDEKISIEKVSLTPVARKILAEKEIPEDQLIEALKNLKITKKDVANIDLSELSANDTPLSVRRHGSRDEDRQKMSTLRLKLSKRLVGVKNETAMLTTFNEVNMTPIKEIREKYQGRFVEKYGFKLGYMAFFTKAVTLAMEEFPKVNSRIEGDEIVVPDFVDVGIAVSAPKGLVVPVIRSAETLDLAEIELKIKELADKARANKITLDEMSGGTFTITNGGVFGSMLSTPILNPPQSAILGMHNIVDRPIAVDGKVEIHPVMYLALSYDHRVIDGKESVSFLYRIKEILEEPTRMLSGGQDPIQAILEL